MKKNRNKCLWIAPGFALSAAFPAALSMLAGMMLAGCSAVDADDIGMTEKDPVPIEFTITGNSLSAETDDPTRAGEETSYNLSFLGWEHNGTYPSTAPNWVGNIYNVTETSQVLSFDPKKYYHESKNTTISGFYPPIVQSSTTPTIGPALYNELSEVMSENEDTGGLRVFPADGTVDIMSSGLKKGSISSKIGKVEMRHLTAQIVLKVVADENDYNDLKSTTIKEITLKKAPIPVAVSYEGELFESYINNDIQVFSGAKAIPQNAVEIGTPAFLSPENNFPEIEVTVGNLTETFSCDEWLSEGYKYIITLTITKAGLKPLSVEVVSRVGGNDDEVVWDGSGDYTIEWGDPGD